MILICKKGNDVKISRLESGHENYICCRGHLNVNVFKTAKKFIDKNFYTATFCSPLDDPIDKQR